MESLRLLVLLPLLGALVVAFLPRRRPEIIYPVSIAVSIPTLVVAIYILVEYSLDGAIFQFGEEPVDLVEATFDAALTWFLDLAGKRQSKGIAAASRAAIDSMELLERLNKPGVTTPQVINLTFAEPTEEHRRRMCEIEERYRLEDPKSRERAS